jgi:glycosyltransferase involved in cell wall biosynthesis
MPVLVVDARSTDRTVAFARSAGAEVVEREWTDFVDARRFALARVRTPWVLMIDADEALDDVLREAIVGAPEDVDGYRVRRTTYFCGRQLRQWRNEPLVRLFRAERGILQAHPAAGGRAALHESWACDGIVGELAGTLLHFSYPDYASYRAKYARYTQTESTGLEVGTAGLLAAWAKSLFVQLPRLLLLKGALLDGPRGAYVAYKSATYPAVVAWKARRR